MVTNKHMSVCIYRGQVVAFLIRPNLLVTTLSVDPQYTFAGPGMYAVSLCVQDETQSSMRIYSRHLSY